MEKTLRTEHSVKALREQDLYSLKEAHCIHRGHCQLIVKEKSSETRMISFHMWSGVVLSLFEQNIVFMLKKVMP